MTYQSRSHHYRFTLVLFLTMKLGSCSGGDAQKTPVDAVTSNDLLVDRATLEDRPQPDDAGIATQDTHSVDRPNDVSWTVPKDEASCIQTTHVPHCDFFPPGLKIERVPSGPLLASVEVTLGVCLGSSCSDSSAGCSSLHLNTPSIAPGDTCDLVINSIDGRKVSARVEAIQIGEPIQQCCGYSLAPFSGLWITYKKIGFQTNPLIVDFTER